MAVVGRLTGRALAGICGEDGRAFEAYHLGPREDVGVPNATSFEADHQGMARKAIWSQLREGTDAVFFDHVGPARIQAWMPRALRVRYAVWLHGIEVWRPLSGDRRRALEGASLLIANSQYTWQRAVAHNPWLSGQAHVVVHLAVEDRSVLPTAPTVPEGPYFLMVGRVSAAEGYKGHQETIEAFARIAPEFPLARLLIAGEGDDRSRLERLAAERLPGAAFRILGFVGDVELESLLAGCRALVLPSTSEGFGLVYAEAMRHGRPFLACAGTVAEEVAGDSGCALLVPPGNPEALAAGLRELLSDSARCDLMGSAGQKAQAARFTEEAFCERFQRAVSSFRRLI